MGCCMSNNLGHSGKDQFKKDNCLKPNSEIYHPMFSTLFNAMRRHTDFDLINGNNDNKGQSGVSIQDAARLPAKTAKMMYSFKRLLVIGGYESMKKEIEELNSKAPVASIFVLNQKQFRSFKEEFSLFKNWPVSTQANAIPLLVFRSEELLHQPGHKLNIFIHSAGRRNQDVYSQLGLSSKNVIETFTGRTSVTPEEQDKLMQEYYLQKLKKNSQSKIVLLHEKSLSQSVLLQILAKFLVSTFDLDEFSVKQYLLRALPQASIQEGDGNLVLASVKNINKTDNKSTVEPVLETLQRLLRCHSDEMGKEKTERGYNLLSKLISNILANPNDDQYRRVKAANKQMEELLGRPRSGQKLLSELGFKEEKGYWVNNMQCKYLKVIRTDLDLAFKQYSG